MKEVVTDEIYSYLNKNKEEFNIMNSEELVEQIFES